MFGINMAMFHTQVFGPDSYNEGILEMLSFQQGNQRRNHHVAEERNAGMVSLSLLIKHCVVTHSSRT